MTDLDPLTEALRRRASDLDHPSPLTLDDVKGRARGIRRRRMAVSGLAAAAVVAVAVPTGIAVSDRATALPDNGPAASPSVSPSIGTSRTPDGTPTPDPAPDGEGPLEVALTANVEGHGGEPQVPYIFDGVINRADGSTAEVHADYTDLAALGDGWAAVRRDDQGNAFVDLLQPDGSVIDSYPSTGSLAASADGTVISYATPDGELMVASPGESPTPLVKRDILPAGTIDTVGVLGTGPCDQPANGGCTVFFDTQDEQDQGGYYAASRGDVQQVPAVRSVNGVAPDGSASATVSISDVGSCSSVLDVGMRPVWKTCDYTLGRFSADGRYVIGHPPYRDGFGDSSVAILDAATGDVLVEYANSQEHPVTVYDVVWDTDGTLIATVFEEGTWALLRLTADGQVTGLVTGLDNAQDDPPVVLPTGP
jgi:hypothetical protein